MTDDIRQSATWGGNLNTLCNVNSCQFVQYDESLIDMNTILLYIRACKLCNCNDHWKSLWEVYLPCTLVSWRLSQTRNLDKDVNVTYPSL